MESPKTRLEKRDDLLRGGTLFEDSADRDQYTGDQRSRIGSLIQESRLQVLRRAADVAIPIVVLGAIVEGEQV